MPSIHLLNKATSPVQPDEIPPGSGTLESGFWLVSIERAESLKGHPIHFHHRRTDAAFQSGIVEDYRRELYTSPQRKTSRRTVFIFTPTPDFGEITTGPDGWTPAGVKYIP